MHIDNFETWFGVNQITSGKKKEMEDLKDLFEECWNNVEGIYEDSYIPMEDHADEIEELEYELDDKEREYTYLEEERDEYESYLKTISHILKEYNSAETQTYSDADKALCSIKGLLEKHRLY